MSSELNQVKEQKSIKRSAESTAPRSSETTTQATQKGSQRSTTSQLSASTKTRTEKTQDQEPKSKQDKSVKSLVSQIRSAEQSSEKVSLSVELVHVIATGIAALFVFTCFALIAIMEIVVGSLNLHNCPVNQMIPIWLTVSGAVSCLRWIIAILFAVKASGGTITAFRGIIELLFSLFWLIWLILGTYWTYSVVNIVTYTAGTATYCNQVAYIVAFLIITLTYVVILIWLFVCCCVMCCAACFLSITSIRSVRQRDDA